MLDSSLGYFTTLGLRNPPLRPMGFRPLPGSLFIEQTRRLCLCFFLCSSTGLGSFFRCCRVSFAITLGWRIFAACLTCCSASGLIAGALITGAVCPLIRRILHALF